MEEYNIDIINLRCPICLDIFKDPYILPCQASCIACFQCICNLFNCAPKPFSENEELQVIGKCICNQQNIPIDKSVPCVGVKRITKNITIKCQNHKHGCPFSSMSFCTRFLVTAPEAAIPRMAALVSKSIRGSSQ